VGIGEIGALVSAASTVLVGLVAVLGWAFRRRTREAREGRKMQATNVAAMAWSYKVEALAAIRGWSQDPNWPALPREMTAEYLLDTAGSEDGTLTQLAKMAQELGKDKP
jgi:hypothetical protein